MSEFLFIFGAYFEMKLLSNVDLIHSCCSDGRVFLAAATAVDVDVGDHPAVVDGRRVHLPVATGESPAVEG